MKKYLLLFPTTHDALVAERNWPRSGFAGKLRPIPRSLSSSCGLCLESELPDDISPMRVAQEQDIPWEQIVEAKGKDLVPIATNKN